jgi:hypothetical protein
MTALTVASAIHCILFSMYITMWTQRLALLGPSGSVTRAIISMRSTAHHVKHSFMVMIGAFSLSMVASFWVRSRLLTRRA